jgi:hypothetical protein
MDPLLSLESRSLPGALTPRVNTQESCIVVTVADPARYYSAVDGNCTGVAVSLLNCSFPAFATTVAAAVTFPSATT